MVMFWHTNTHTHCDGSGDGIDNVADGDSDNDNIATRKFTFILFKAIIGMALRAIKIRQKQPTTQPQLFLDIPTILTTYLDCKSAHMQTLKWAWQRNFERRNLASNAQ